MKVMHEKIHISKSIIEEVEKNGLKSDKKYTNFKNSKKGTERVLQISYTRYK